MPQGIRVIDQFIELADAPSAFTGKGYYLVRVNVGETAVEFGAAVVLSDTEPANYFPGMIWIDTS